MTGRMRKQGSGVPARVALTQRARVPFDPFNRAELARLAAVDEARHDDRAPWARCGCGYAGAPCGDTCPSCGADGYAAVTR